MASTLKRFGWGLGILLLGVLAWWLVNPFGRHGADSPVVPVKPEEEGGESVAKLELREPTTGDRETAAAGAEDAAVRGAWIPDESDGTAGGSLDRESTLRSSGKSELRMQITQPFTDRPPEECIALLGDAEHTGPEDRLRAAMTLAAHLMLPPNDGGTALNALIAAARNDPEERVRHTALVGLRYHPSDAAYYALDAIARGPESADQQYVVSLLKKFVSDRGERWFLVYAKRYGYSESAAERLYESRRDFAAATIEAVSRD